MTIDARKVIARALWPDYVRTNDADEFDRIIAEREETLDRILAALEANGLCIVPNPVNILDEYAASYRRLSCEAYLVDKLTFSGADGNVKLAYGRTQGIELVADRLRAMLAARGSE